MYRKNIVAFCAFSGFVWLYRRNQSRYIGPAVGTVVHLTPDRNGWRNAGKLSSWFRTDLCSARRPMLNYSSLGGFAGGPMPFQRRKSFTILHFPLFLAAVLVCSLAVNMTAQEQPTSSQSINKDNDQERSEARSAPEVAQSSPHKRDPSLQLGVGDLIEMTVYDVPDLATKTRISSTGDIYCPLIGPTHVAGLTTEEAEKLIEKRLSAFLKDPYVSLFVTEYASQGASLLGEVAKPGIYPVLGERHLFDLISASGGLTEKAGHGVTVTHRGDPDTPVTVQLSRNLSDHPESNIKVFPGDTIVVHKADIVYVVGDVGRPSGLLMGAGGLTVLQAVALAGGTTRTAKLSGAKILHKGPAGMTETPVHLKKILQAKAPDLPLQADDILVVPSSSGKILAGRTLEAAMQAATLVSVTAVP
jgi:polysaccharide biosynthesis/export protein